MVLQDTPFRDMTEEKMLTVTRPKVEGSIHLDELFFKDALDFFIFFSSIVAVLGNAGQSNYSAANAFMTSLARQRRRKGLAASVINIGPILGVGYIAQEDLHLRMRADLLQRGLICMAEQDFLQLFAEGIVVGRSGSTGPIEITTGFAEVSLNARIQPVWFSNPLMSQFLLHEETTNQAVGNKKIEVPLKAQIAQAQSQEQIYDIVKVALIMKLCILFQLDPDTFDRSKSLSNVQIDQLGIDSLLAVEIRSWFLKSLDVNIPVLRILNGVSVHELIEVAVGSLVPASVPDLTSALISLSTPPDRLSPPPCGEPPSSTISESVNLEISDDEHKGTSMSSTPLSDSAAYSQPSCPAPVVLKSVKLSFSQAMFWFVSRFLEDKTGLNHTGCFRLTGRLRLEDFRSAVGKVGQRHEVLRTQFFTVNEEPMQGIMDSSVLKLEHRHVNAEDQVAKVVSELESYVYDLERGVAMRVLLLSLSTTTHFLLIGAHSLVMDGISFQILMKDLLQFYNRQSLMSDILQYPEFSERQHDDFKAGKLDRELGFWKQEFADFPPQLPILRVSHAISHPVLKAYRNERVDLRLDQATKLGIQSICRQCAVTPFHFYLSVFRILLSRYADIDDVAIGIGDANRSDVDKLESIGPYINLLPLRFRNTISSDLAEVLKETRSKTYSALANSNVPFQVLLDEYVHQPWCNLVRNYGNTLYTNI